MCRGIITAIRLDAASSGEGSRWRRCFDGFAASIALMGVSRRCARRHGVRRAGSCAALIPATEARPIADVGISTYVFIAPARGQRAGLPVRCRHAFAKPQQAPGDEVRRQHLTRPATNSRRRRRHLGTRTDRLAASKHGSMNVDDPADDRSDRGGAICRPRARRSVAQCHTTTAAFLRWLPPPEAKHVAWPSHDIHRSPDSLSELQSAQLASTRYFARRGARHRLAAHLIEHARYSLAAAAEYLARFSVARMPASISCAVRRRWVHGEANSRPLQHEPVMHGGRFVVMPRQFPALANLGGGI